MYVKYTLLLQKFALCGKLWLSIIQGLKMLLKIISACFIALFVCASWKGVVVFMLGMKAVRILYSM
jgi:hypothetical protein